MYWWKAFVDKAEIKSDDLKINFFLEFYGLFHEHSYYRWIDSLWNSWQGLYLAEMEIHSYQ